MSNIMIEFSSWPPMFRIVILVCPTMIVLSGLALSFYIACSRDFFIALSAIKSSPWLEQQKNYMGVSSVRSRWMLVLQYVRFVASARSAHSKRVTKH